MSSPKTPLLSIIVPVFNSAKYLSNCVDGILDQTFQDFECILVDDGSTDESLDMCKKFAGLDNRIRVLHQRNGGVSSARNLGLRNCSGSYVAFVDSDDAVFPEMYQVMLDGQMRRNSDVVCCGYLHKDKSYSLPEFFYVENQARGVYELEKGELFGLIWNKLYKKDILDKKNIRFSPGQFFGEDFLFNLKYFSAIYAILNIPHVLYKYNDNSESSITKTRPPFEQSHFRFTHVSTEIIKLKDTGNYIHMLLALDFSYTVFLIRNLYIPFLSPYRKRVEIISEIKGFYREHKAKTSFRGKKYFFFYRYLKVAPLLILDRTFRIFFLIVFKMRGYS